jgi:hypothetical protein
MLKMPALGSGSAGEGSPCAQMLRGKIIKMDSRLQIAGITEQEASYPILVILPRPPHALLITYLPGLATGKIETVTTTHTQKHKHD